MKRLSFLSALLVVVALSACELRPDTVDLTYLYEPKSETTYEMTATADVKWNIAGRKGGGGYEITFDISEKVESVDEEGTAVVTVQMSTTGFEERGLPSPGSQNRSFKLELGPNGEKTEVLEVDGVPAADLDRDELAFIGTYRPPLPIDPVDLNATWPSVQSFQLPNLFQKVEGLSELTGLDQDEGGDVAEIDYASEGPLEFTTTLPQGTAQLKGVEETTSTAEFDISGGFLRKGASTTKSEFDVSVQPSDGRAPQQGTLVQDLRVEIELKERKT